MGNWTAFNFIAEQWTRLSPPLSTDLTSKTILVTGANSGIGFEVAKTFARMQPRKLFLACRNTEKGKAAVAAIQQSTGYHGLQLAVFDLADFSSVVRFAQSLENEPLDILIANAGLGMDEYTATRDGWETTLQVNHLATALLSLLLLPNLVRTGQTNGTTSRLVVTSSDTHYWTKLDEEVLRADDILRKLNDKKYCTPKVMARRYLDTKLFNILFTHALADHLPVSMPLIPTTVNPGYCRSDIRRHHQKYVVQSAIFAVMDHVVGRSAEEGARQLVWAALGPDGKEGRHANWLRGAYVSTQSVMEPSDFVMSEQGGKVQEKVWYETLDILSEICPEVRTCVDEYFTA